MQISVLCYLYALYFNSLYACTVHVAELTIKQTLTYVYINIHTYSIYLGKYFQNIYCMCVYFYIYIYIYIYIINIHSTYTYYVN